MASILKNCSIKNVLSRSYALAAPKPKPITQSIVPHESCVTIENDIVITSIENLSPISSVAILYKSGPRYETIDTYGISFALRSFAAFESNIASSFIIGRTLQQSGTRMICEADREYMIYQCSSLREHLGVNLNILANCATEHIFKQWQVDECEDRLIYENNVFGSPSTLLLEMLHKAAYRNQSLGNGILMPEFRKGQYTTGELSQFMEGTHTNKRMAIVGLGLEHSELVEMAKNIRPQQGEGISSGMDPCKYQGAMDVRKETNESLAYVAVVGAGAKFGSPEVASLSVAGNILCSNQKIVNYPRNISRLSKFQSAISAVGGQGTAVPLNINYSDSGLFGFMLIEEAAKAGESTRALVDTIKGLKVTDSDIKEAVTRMKSKILMKGENGDSIMEDMGKQALFQRTYTPYHDFSALDNVTVASVQSALSTMLKNKPCVAAYGGIHNVPYYDQL